MFLKFLRYFKNPSRKLIFSVYLSCAFLFLLWLVSSRGEKFAQILLHPLDASYSILGTKSSHKDIRSKNVVYAFLPYWVSLENIDLSRVTDLVYFGLHVDSNGEIVKTDEPYTKWKKDSQLLDVLNKAKKRGIRVSLTLICHQDEDIQKILSCEGCWKNLLKDLKAELDGAKIKDVNIDFEFSGYTSLDNALKYTKLISYLNTNLDAAYGDSFVVVSVYADSASKSAKLYSKGFSESSVLDNLVFNAISEHKVRLTEPKSLGGVSDAIFIMAYDFHRPSSENAGPVSPLGGVYNGSSVNVSQALEAFQNLVPSNKLILGLPLYGYDWLVESSDPMSKRVEGNELIGFSKTRTYADITNLLVKKQIQPMWDETSKTPYFNYIDDETGSLRQVWYDNEKSLALKASLVKDKRLLGAGIWALGFEGGYKDLLKPFALDFD